MKFECIHITSSSRAWWSPQQSSSPFWGKPRRLCCLRQHHRGFFHGAVGDAVNCTLAVQSWGRDCPAISVVSYFVCCQFCVYHVALTKILDLPQRFAGYSYIGSTEDLNKQVFIMQAILATFTSCSHNSPEFKVFANATYITTYIIIFYLKYILFLLNLW
jgi:hypothetical protein